MKYLELAIYHCLDAGTGTLNVDKVPVPMDITQGLIRCVRCDKIVLDYG